MPYQINKFNGDRLVVLEDGTLDSTTSVGLVGKNFAGYGEIQNENFLWLLENFAGTAAPNKAIIGQLWYDADAQRIKVYTGTAWNIVGNTTISAAQPIENAPGDGWLDTDSNQFYVYDGTEFKFVGPEAVTDFGTTRLVSTKIRDTGSTFRPVIKVTLNDTVIGIITERDFDILVADAVPGFSSLKKGITLSSTSFLKGAVVGNASSASTLETPRTINGVSFDGSANIVVKSSTTNYLVGGNYIVGNDFDGSATTSWSIDATSSNIDDKIVARDSLGNFSASTITADLTGNTTGTHYGNVQGNVAGNTLGTHTGPVIGNVTGNVTGTVTGAVNGLIGNTSPTSATFTVVSINDELKFLGSAGTSGQVLKSRGAGLSPEWGSATIDLTTQVTNTLSVGNGGLGRNTLTLNHLVVGGGGSPVQLIAPGPSGNILSSTGVAWESIPNGIVAQVAYFARQTAPSGWLVCNGQAVSRTTYSTLFSAIGSLWGGGDGVTTFNLPDLRGEFIRGWDAGRGVDEGRTFASQQTDSIESHGHIFDDIRWSEISGSYTYNDPQLGTISVGPGAGSNRGTDYDNGAHFLQHGTYNTGIHETRPRNVAMLPCIKF
jgi:hypothetical protein